MLSSQKIGKIFLKRGLLSIFALMKSKNAISKLLLITALLFTVVFQFAHSLSHFSDDLHSFTDVKTVTLTSQNDNQSTHFSTAEHAMEKCFACDFFLSPFLQTESLVFQVVENTHYNPIKTLVEVPFYTVTSIFFSLRAPPALF